MELNKLSKEDFTPYLQTTFRVWLSEEQFIEVALIRIDALPLPPFRMPWITAEEAPVVRAPFSLLFCFPTEPALPQRMYHFDHAQLGRIPNLFIAPLGADHNGRYYEAIFN